MEANKAKSWIEITSSEGRRLDKVESVMIWMAEDKDDFDGWVSSRGDIAGVFQALQAACPLIKKLRVQNIASWQVEAFFKSLGQYLPNIEVMELHDGPMDVVANLDDIDVDWSECLPRGLRKLEAPGVRIYLQSISSSLYIFHFGPIQE